MTRDEGEMDWWARLADDDARSIHWLAAPHHAKLHVAVARHLATDHAQRFDRQVSLPDVTGLHNELHGAATDNPWVFVPHGLNPSG